MKEDLEGEIWKPVVGYEGLYEVSNFGRVKSLPKEWVSGRGGRRKHNGKILKLSVDNNGYCRTNLYKEGKHKSNRIHQLVAMVFLGHVPDGYNIVVDHKDNNPSNNHVSNLQLISNRENTSKDKKGTSKYTGVIWYKQRSKWRSNIRINGRRIHLGYFHNEEEAGKIYQSALKYIDNYDGDDKAFREFILNQRKR